MLRHSCGFKLVNDNHSLRAIQCYLGHVSINSTVRYTELASTKFRDFFPRVAKGTGTIGRGIKRRALSAAPRGGAAQIPKGAEASRVDPEAGPVKRPHMRGGLRDRLGE